jgi:hypothetical protein
MSPEDVAKVLGLLLLGSEALSLMPKVRANGWLQLTYRILKALGKEFGQGLKSR